MKAGLCVAASLLIGAFLPGPAAAHPNSCQTAGLGVFDNQKAAIRCYSVLRANGGVTNFCVPRGQLHHAHTNRGDKTCWVDANGPALPCRMTPVCFLIVGS